MNWVSKIGLAMLLGMIVSLLDLATAALYARQNETHFPIIIVTVVASLILIFGDEINDRTSQED